MFAIIEFIAVLSCTLFAVPQSTSVSSSIPPEGAAGHTARRWAQTADHPSGGHHET